MSAIYQTLSSTFARLQCHIISSFTKCAARLNGGDEIKGCDSILKLFTMLYAVTVGGMLVLMLCFHMWGTDEGWNWGQQSILKGILEVSEHELIDWVRRYRRDLGIPLNEGDNPVWDWDSGCEME
jgi:hypothetical protein